MKISNTTPVISSSDLMTRHVELINKQMLSRNINQAENDELIVVKHLIDQLRQAGAGAALLRTGIPLVHHQKFHDWAMDRLCDTIPEIEKLPSVIKIDWKTSTDQFKGDFYPVYYAGEMYWVQPYS